MDLVYKYSKLRQNFGCQPKFSETMSHFLDTIPPGVLEQKKYCLRNPVDTPSQATPSVRIHDTNTKYITIVTNGMQNSEGGWPKDINFTDEETTTRHCRHVERSDEYVEAVLSLSPQLENLIKQNNGIHMYEHYYKDMPEFKKSEKPAIYFVNVFKDPLHEAYKRPVASIGWTYEDNPKMIVTYSDKKCIIRSNLVNANLDFYVWDLANPSLPINDFVPPTPCWQIVCAPNSPDIIVGGLEDGRVCIFDIRLGKSPTSISEMHLAHRDPISALVYLESRLNNEFFSGSSDGKCLWYDIRSLAKPIDSLCISVHLPPGELAAMANAEPISVLSFNTMFPTRFLCGTDTGLIVNVNRKGKFHNEVMSAVVEAHLGPVKALQRNPFISKMIISCGDWTTHIWSDDICTSPIICGSPQPCQIEDVVWAPQRVSSYMSVGRDGKFCYWDLTRKEHEPVIIMPMCNNPLLKIKPQSNGRIVAMGDSEGNLYVISLSENLVLSDERDKQKIIQLYDRETHRERILETRVKEIRVKTKVDKETFFEVEEVTDNYEAQVVIAEKEYRQAVLDEIKASGIPLT